MRENLAVVSDTATVRPVHHVLPHQCYYPAKGKQVTKAREELIGRLHSWGLGHLADDASLALSELFTNAVRHAVPTPPGHLLVDARLVIENGQRCLRLGVTDTDRESADRVRLPEGAGRDLSEGGRGLFLIKELSLRWGVEPTRLGKTVWCDFDTARRA